MAQSILARLHHPRPVVEPVVTHQQNTTALAADAPKVRMCPDCRDGKHMCAGFAFDANDNRVPCPCLTCHPPAPERCGSCSGFINPETGECRCSD